MKIRCNATSYKISPLGLGGADLQSMFLPRKSFFKQNVFT
jgi:hypothetical protein